MWSWLQERAKALSRVRLRPKVHWDQYGRSGFQTRSLVHISCLCLTNQGISRLRLLSVSRSWVRLPFLKILFNIKHADQHFVPIFCHIGNRESIIRVNKIWVRPLSKNKNYSLLISAIHPEDLKELITDTDQSFFCLRLEPWVLKKWDLI